MQIVSVTTAQATVTLTASELLHMASTLGETIPDTIGRLNAAARKDYRALVEQLDRLALSLVESQ